MWGALSKLLFGSLMALSLVGVATADSTYSVVHHFDGHDGGLFVSSLTSHQTDPNNPSSWALFGVAEAGGNTAKVSCQDYVYVGCGLVFRISPPVPGSKTWVETRLYVFSGDYLKGYRPDDAVVFDKSGALYGTTREGGTYLCQQCGTVFRLTPPRPGHGYFWNQAVLHRFTDRADGSIPEALLLNEAGAVLGTAAGGYSNLFSLLPKAGSGEWPFSIITSGTTLVTPLDKTGALIGIGLSGSPSADHLDFITTLTPPSFEGAAWSSKLDYTFTTADDGPATTPLVPDGTGAFYGTTDTQVQMVPNHGEPYGTIFRMVPPAPGSALWTKTVLFTFTNPDLTGAFPIGRLYLAPSGALYGVTSHGGRTTCPRGCGVIYKVTPPTDGSTNWTETILHYFELEEGLTPQPTGGLVPGPDGALYGTTIRGGVHRAGVVFRITP